MKFAITLLLSYACALSGLALSFTAGREMKSNPTMFLLVLAAIPFVLLSMVLAQESAGMKLTLPPATSECGDARETDGARNIKNDAGEAARKETE